MKTNFVFGIGGGGLLQRVDQLPAHDEDEVVTAVLGDVVELLLIVERAVAGVDELHFDAEIGLGLLQAVDDRDAEALREVSGNRGDGDLVLCRGGSERYGKHRAGHQQTLSALFMSFPFSFFSAFEATP